MALNTTAEIMLRAKGGMEQESDLQLARDALPGSVKTAEAFRVANPRNRDITAVVMMAFCGYAGFLQDDWEVAVAAKRFDEARRVADSAARIFLRCVNYGLVLLGPSWQEQLYGPIDGVRALLNKTDKSHVQALMWTAMGLGGAINMMQGDVRVVAHLSKVELMLQRVVDLEPTYEHGTAHMLLGAIYCGRAQALGGEPARGKQHVAAAISVRNGNYLMPRVLMARYCAVATQDRQLFHQTLLEVLRTSPAVFPEQRLANEFAHYKARRYLRQENEFF
jgi:hypothetical protein